MIRKLLHKAARLLKTEGRPEPDAEHPDLDAQMRELIEEYGSEVRQDSEKDRRAPWIFQGHVDHEVYKRAGVALLEEARRLGRQEGSAAIEHWPDDCACRCIAHRRVACPVCLDLTVCPVHSEPDPGRVSPKWREELPVEAMLWPCPVHHAHPHDPCTELERACEARLQKAAEELSK